MKNRASRLFKEKEFFRGTSLEVLQGFLHTHNLAELSMENTQEDFCNKYKDYPDIVKDNLSYINDLSNDRGMSYLVEVCAKYNIEFQNIIPNDLAIRVFTENREAFFEAFNWLNIDLYDKFIDFQGKEQKEPSHKNLGIFEKELGEYLTKLAKGNKIHIERYDKENKIAYVINYGDYLRPLDMFENDNFITRKIRQAKTITLIYYPKLAKLRINCPTAKLQDAVIELYSKYILGNEDFFKNSENVKFFDLSRIATMKEEEYTLNPLDGIDKVEITNIKAYLSSNKKANISITSPKDLMKIIETSKLDFNYINIFSVKIKFKFANSGRNNRRTIEITEPNISNLNESPRDNLIKKYLKLWEIASA